MRFLNELPGKDWIDIHAKVFGNEGVNENFVMVRPSYEVGNALEVYYKEKDSSGYWMEVSYIFSDFYRPVCQCPWVAREDNIDDVEKRFFAYMVNRFGEDYIHAFFEARTGVKIVTTTNGTD